MSDPLTLVEPGPLAQQIGCELARICLRLGQSSQAVSVCLQLLEHTEESAEKKEIQTLLAEAYRQQEQYDRAVSVLLEAPTASSSSGGALPNPGVGI